MTTIEGSGLGSLFTCWNSYKEEEERHIVGVHDLHTGGVIKEFRQILSQNGNSHVSAAVHVVCEVTTTEFAVSCGGGDVPSSTGGDVLLCSEASGKVISTLPGNSSDAQGLALIRSAKLLASGNIKGELVLWDVADPTRTPAEKRGELKGHTSALYGLINPESLSHLLLSGSFDGTARVWDWAREECLKTIEAPGGVAQTVSLAYNDERGVMMTAKDKDKTVKMWDLRNNYQKIAEIGQFDGDDTDEVNLLLYREANHRLAVVHNKGAIRMFDVRNTGAALRKFDIGIQGAGWGCEIPDRSSFCLSCWKAGGVCAVKEDGSVAWLATKTGLRPNGICPFGSFDSRAGISPAVDEAVEAVIEAVEDQSVSTINLQGTNGVVVRIPRTLCGREILDETVHVNAELGVLGEKDLLSLLCGGELSKDTPPATLILLAKVFQALHLPAHLFHLCQYIEGISDPSRIAFLASNCDGQVHRLEGV